MRVMRVVVSIKAMQQLARGWHREGVTVGMVPTMGYLHEGHLSLVHRARRLTGRRGEVVVRIYVNPAQSVRRRICPVTLRYEAGSRPVP